MIRDLSRLAKEPFDVLVIGGGIHGLAVAYDAAQRGYSVALVERGDFGSGTSFNHLKTVHGGLRSLQTGDVRKARFSVRERRAMARIAPGLVTPLSFMMATTRKLTRSSLALRAGFLADAALGFDRNAAVMPELRLPAGRVVGREAYREIFAANARPEATGGAVWWDYHMAQSDRLTLAFAKAADTHGATLANYTEAVEPLMRAGRVVGLRVRDCLEGAAFEIEARITVNAAGAFSRAWMAKFGAAADFPLLKAMNLVTSRPAAGPIALGAPTSGSRLLLVTPWRGRLIVGTSHSDRPSEADDLSVSRAEVAAFVDEVNSAFPALALTEHDVTLVHRGVVPAERDRRGVLGLMGHHRIHDHHENGVEGALSVVGVKYTTGRGAAEQVVDLVGLKLGRPGIACRTGTTRLPPCDFDSPAAETARVEDKARGLMTGDCAAALVWTHGTEWRPVVALCKAEPDLAEPIAQDVALPKAAIVHAVRSEMACTLADVLVRRLPVGAAGYPGDAAVASTAALMARLCGWDAGRVSRETEALRALYRIV
jgi:glycerol-3-phosphate dehydrogenase